VAGLSGSRAVGALPADSGPGRGHVDGALMVAGPCARAVAPAIRLSTLRCLCSSSQPRFSFWPGERVNTAMALLARRCCRVSCRWSAARLDRVSERKKTRPGRCASTPSAGRATRAVRALMLALAELGPGLQNDGSSSKTSIAAHLARLCQTTKVRCRHSSRSSRNSRWVTTAQAIRGKRDAFRCG